MSWPENQECQRSPPQASYNIFVDIEDTLSSVPETPPLPTMILNSAILLSACISFNCICSPSLASHPLLLPCFAPRKTGFLEEERLRLDFADFILRELAADANDLLEFLDDFDLDRDTDLDCERDLELDLPRCCDEFRERCDEFREDVFGDFPTRHAS